jgi:hypothetical protein
MPEIEEHTVVEDGMVMGYVRTDNKESECYFEILSVEEWILLSEEEAEKLAQGCLHDSGVMEWGY